MKSLLLAPYSSAQPVTQTYSSAPAPAISPTLSRIPTPSASTTISPSTTPIAKPDATHVNFALSISGGPITTFLSQPQLGVSLRSSCASLLSISNVSAIKILSIAGLPSGNSIDGSLSMNVRRQLQGSQFIITTLSIDIANPSVVRSYGSIGSTATAIRLLFADPASVSAAFALFTNQWSAAVNASGVSYSLVSVITPAIAPSSTDSVAGMNIGVIVGAGVGAVFIAGSALFWYCFFGNITYCSSPLTLLSQPSDRYPRHRSKELRIVQIAHSTTQARTIPLKKRDKTKIFLSHCWANKPLAEALKHRIEERGVRCWIDTEQIGGGAWLYDEISLGIDECPVFMSFVSKEYIASENCNKEFNLAVDWKRHIVAVNLVDGQWPPKGGFAPSLAGKVYLDGKIFISDEKLNKMLVDLNLLNH
jgi:TIR domain